MTEEEFLVSKGVDPLEYRAIEIESVFVGYARKDTIRPIKDITVGSFRSRLTLAEKVAMKASTDPVVQVLIDDLGNSSHVDVEDAELIAGLTYLKDTAGILTTERITEILVYGTEAEEWKAPY